MRPRLDDDDEYNKKIFIEESFYTHKLLENDIEIIYLSYEEKLSKGIIGWE